MNLGLENAHVLVTGGSRGIGYAISQVLLREGAKVTVHYNKNKVKAERLLQEFPRERIYFGKADLRIEEEVISLFENSIKALGPIDGLVANAGIWPEQYTLTSDMTLEQWENTIKVNLTGVFLSVREFFKNLREYPREDASIVLIGSTAGKYGEAGHADYAATKAALMYGLTRTWKNEIVKLAPRGRVNTVAPGWIYTEMAENSLQDHELVKRILQTVPLKKIGKPSDIAQIVTYLLSAKAAGHITGQTLMVEGGMEGRVLHSPEDIDLDKIL